MPVALWPAPEHGLAVLAVQLVVARGQLARYWRSHPAEVRLLGGAQLFEVGLRLLEGDAVGARLSLMCVHDHPTPARVQCG